MLEAFTFIPQTVAISVQELVDWRLINLCGYHCSLASGHCVSVSL